MARGASYYYFLLKIHYAWDEDDVVLFQDYTIYDCTRLQWRVTSCSAVFIYNNSFIRNKCHK